MKKTVFNIKRNWIPDRPLYVPDRNNTTRKEASEGMKDVYFVELIANPVCDRMTIASIFDKLFANVRVIYASSTSTEEKLNKFCSEVKTLLLSWPGKVIIVGSPEFCVHYAKTIGKPFEDHTSRLFNMRPEKRVIIRIATLLKSVPSVAWQAAVEEKALSETNVDANEIVDILSLQRRLKEIGKQHFDLIENGRPPTIDKRAIKRKKKKKK